MDHEKGIKRKYEIVCPKKEKEEKYEAVEENHCEKRKGRYKNLSRNRFPDKYRIGKRKLTIMRKDVMKLKNKCSKHSHIVLSIIACMLLIPIIVINITIIFKGFSDSDNLPGVMGYRPVIVLSGSMEPTFDTGDMILLEPIKDIESLQKDDVVAYLIGGKVTTHRIVQVTELEGKRMYITKGDYNNIEDRIAVSPEQIQGIYEGKRIPQLGNILMFLQSNMGIVIFLGIPFASYILWDIFKRRKENDKKTKELEQELAKLKAEKELGSEVDKREEANKE